MNLFILLFFKIKSLLLKNYIFIAFFGMEDDIRIKIIRLIKNIHITLGNIYRILHALDKIYEKKDSYVLLYKTYLLSYMKCHEETLLVWHNSILVLQNFFDNKTFEIRMFEKINGCFFYDDVLRVRYKSEIHSSIAEFGRMMFELNNIFFVHANITLT